MSVIDIIVIVLYMAALVGIGLYANSKIKTTEDYVLGGKRFGVGSLTGTIMATMMGSGMVIGMIANTFKNGLGGSVVWVYGGMAVGMFFTAACASQIRKTEALSFAEIIGKTFGKNARIVAAISVVAYAIGILSINITALSTVLGVVFADYNIPKVWLTIIGTLIAVTYTTLGGFFAVVWTDVAQFAIMVLFLFILGPIIGITKAGGMDVVVDAVVAKGGSWTPAFSTGMLGLALSYFLATPGDPTMPQRVLAGKDTKSVKIAFTICGFLSIFVIASLTLMGSSMAALMPNASGDSIVTSYILGYFPPVIKGLTLAALLAAIMSSFDSFLVLGTTHLIYDIVGQIKPDLKEKETNKIQRIAVVVMGALTVVIALASDASVLDKLNVIFSVLGAITVPALLAALFFKKSASKFGVIAGMVTGFVVPTVLFFTKGYDVWLGDPVFIGLFAAIAVLILGSVLVKDKK